MDPATNTDFQTDWAALSAADGAPSPPEQAPPAPPAPAPGANTDFQQDWAALQAAPTGTPPSPAEQREAALRTSVNAALPGNPDAAAKADAVAQKTGLPRDVVERNPAQADAIARSQAINVPELLHRNPAVATWLSNPDNAAVAHDDVANLQHVDFATRTLLARMQPQTQPAIIDQPQENRPDLPLLQGVGAAARAATYPLAQKLWLPFAVGQHVYRWLSGADESENYTPPGPDTPLGMVLTAHDIMEQEAKARTSYAPSLVRDAVTGVVGAVADPSNILAPVAGGTLAAKAAPALASAAEKAARALLGAASTQAVQAGGQGLETTLGATQRDTGKATVQGSDLTNAGAQAAFAFLTGKAAGLVGPLASLRGEELRLADIPRDVLANQTVGGVQSAGAPIIQSLATGSPAPSPGDIAQAYLTGGLVGTLFSGLNIPGARAMSKADAAVRSTQQALAAQENARALARVGVATQLSKTATRSPDRFQELVKQTADAVGAPAPGHVLFQASDWDSHWAQHGDEHLASDMATALTGDDTAYARAKATGGDLAIPLDAYAARIGPTEHYEPLLDKARLQPDGMTLGESQKWLESAPGVMKDIGKEVKAEVDRQAASVDPTGDLVRQQLVEHLVNAGHSADSANYGATLHQNFWQRMAELHGGSVQEMADKYPLTASQEVPQAIQGSNADHLDAQLNKIRGGEGVGNEGIFGSSLSDFFRSKSGLKDTGGDLHHIGLDAPVPFKKKLVHGKGMELDKAAEAAHEAGFLRNNDVPELLAKLTDEAHGKPHYSVDAFNPDLHQRAQEQAQLAAFLKDIGADPKTMTNDEIRAMIAEHQKAMPGEGPNVSRYNQAAWHGTGNPKPYDRFGIEHVNGPGGEGAQTYGHGLYFTSGKEVGAFYREQNSRGNYQFSIDGKEIEDPAAVQGLEHNGKAIHAEDAKEALESILRFIKEDGYTISEAAGRTYAEAGIEAEKMEKAGEIGQAKDYRNLQQAARALSDKLTAKPLGKLYHVDIPERGEMLDWHGQIIDYAGHEALLDKLNALNQSVEYSGDMTGESVYRALSRELGGDKQASAFLRENGVPGMTFKGRTSGVRNYVVYDDARIAIKSFEQNPNGKVNGYITVNGTKFHITFTPNGNLTTFLHESAHYFFHVISDLAGKEGAPAQLVADYKAILDWLGVKSIGEMTTEHHEKVAEAMENYFAEGKAPSVELRGVFQRFKAWMMLTYNRLQPYPHMISPEVHAAFDRMFASDHEIQAAQDRAGDNAALPREAFTGSDADYGKYVESIAAVKERAESDLRAKLMRAYREEHSARWDEERENVRSDIADKINNRPEYAAIRALQDGRTPDGRMLPDEFQGLKLSRKDLVDRYGPELLKALPGPRQRDANGDWIPKANAGRHLYVNEGGISLDDAAEEFGYRSGDELWQALTSAPDRVTTIESETDAEMRARHPDPLLDGTIAQKADETIASEGRGKLLAAEVRNLSAKAGKVATPHQIIKITAERTIGSTPAGQLRPDMHRVAEAKARAKAFEAAATGDHDAAFLHSQQALLNHELYRAAVKAKDAVERIQQHMVDLGKPAARERLGKAGGWEWTVTDPYGKEEKFGSEEEAKSASDKVPGSTWERTSSYLDQIDGFRARYEFARVSQKVLDRRESLRQYIDAQKELGMAVAIPDEAMQETVTANWKTLTVDHLQAISDAVKNIEATAKLKNQLMRAEAERSLSETAEKCNTSIRESNVTAVKATKSGSTTFSGLTDPIGRALNAFKRVSDLIYRIDGHITGGVLFDQYLRPMNEATDAKAVRIADSLAHVNGLLDEWGKEGIGGINNWRLNRPIHFKSVDRSFNKWSVIKMAMDFGSSGNRERMLENNGWTEAQMRSILDTLDAKDIALVNGLTKHIGSFRSEIGALEQRTKGVAPKWVDGLPYDVKGGHIDGGYCPICYDTENHPHLRRSEDDEINAILSGGGAAASYTSHNHTKARTGNAGVPLSTDFGDITTHLTRVIHDLTLREAMMDANRLLKRIGPTLTERYGTGVVPQFQAQIRAVASGGIRISNSLEPLVGFLRQGANAGVRAFNVAGFLQQLAGMPFVIPRTGVVNAIRAIGPAVNPMAHITLEHLSTVMRFRNAERGRILNEAYARTSTFRPLNGFRNTAYMFLNTAWKILDAHAWHASYYKAQEAFGDDETKCRAIADAQVADTQGATDTKDMSEIMRGGEFSKILTNNMSWANANLNLMLLSMQRFADKGKTPGAGARMAADMAAYLVVAPAIYLAVRQAMTQSDMSDWTDPKKAAKMLGQEAGYTLLSSVPIGRDIAPVLEHDKARYSGPQGASFLGTLFSAAAQSREAVEGEGTRSRSAVSPGERAALDLSGVLFHVPAAQIEHMLAGWHAAETQHMNPILPTLIGAPAKPHKNR